ncbi:hypothetical protein Hanom_Chr09g00845371 [Helianthus anomalus]
MFMEASSKNIVLFTSYIFSWASTLDYVQHVLTFCKFTSVKYYSNSFLMGLHHLHQRYITLIASL